MEQVDSSPSIALVFPWTELDTLVLRAVNYICFYTQEINSLGFGPNHTEVVLHFNNSEGQCEEMDKGRIKCTTLG